MIAGSFRAMGTSIDVRTTDPRGLRATRRWFEDVEATASRFRPDSSLVALNTDPHELVPVAPLLAELLSTAMSLGRCTDGLVDPTVGRRVAEWGYDRSFERVTSRAVAPEPAPEPTGWSISGNLVRRRPGTVLDLGGVAKGWAADRAVEQGLASVVSAGGDIRSSLPDTIVRVDGPDGTMVAEVALGARGLATSSVARRRWMVGDRDAHHLIDPRTGNPALGPVVSATAVAATAALAEGAAKAVLLRGVDGLAWAASRAWVDGALVVWEDGAVYATVDLEVAA